MKVCVVGLGSMGKRRIRLLREMNSSLEISGVDGNAARRVEAAALYGMDTYEKLEEALLDDDTAVFVCTGPISHSGIIREALERGCHVFSEINLISDGYDENIQLAKDKGRVLFLSSTMLYREEIKYLIQRIHEASPLVTYDYHVGQYLPDWHPWESFKEYFIGDKRTNGCREIMAIELPWLIRAFGGIKDIHAVRSRITALDIDYPDSYHIIITHSTGIVGAFHVDIASRKACRDLSVQGEGLHIEWNGRHDGLKEYDFGEKRLVDVKLYQEVQQISKYNSTITENAYRDEILEFFDVIRGNSHATYAFEEDRNLLCWIDRIEGAPQ